MVAQAQERCYRLPRMEKRKTPNAAASAMAKLRWSRMTQKQRSEIMKNAANARWEAYRKAKQQPEEEA